MKRELLTPVQVLQAISTFFIFHQKKDPFYQFSLLPQGQYCATDREAVITAHIYSNLKVTGIVLTRLGHKARPISSVVF